MTIHFVQGDIFLSRAQVIGLSFNARGRTETDPLVGQFMYHYPAAFAAFRKQAHAGRIQTGQWWLWREASPWLALLITRQSQVGAMRSRYVEAVAQQISVNWQQEGVHSMALARPGDALEWPMLREVLTYWFELMALPVVVYEQHIAGQNAPEPWDVGV